MIRKKRCSHCKNEYEATPDNFYRKKSNADGLENYCVACRRQHNRKQYLIYSKKEEVRNRITKRKRERYAMNAWSSACYTVLVDPDPVAGFRPGAMLPRMQVTLDLKNFNFTPGTVLQAQRHLYRVDEVDGKQVLVEV